MKFKIGRESDPNNDNVRQLHQPRPSDDPGPRPSRVNVLTVEQQPDMARSRKVTALTATLIQYNFSREQVIAMAAEDWKVIAHHAGVNPPGSAETVEDVLYALEIHDKLLELKQKIEMRLVFIHGE